MTLGFGTVVVATVLLHNIIFVNLDEFLSTVRQDVESDVVTIDAARKLGPLLDEEERSTRKLLILGTPVTARLRREAHDHVSASLDSLGWLLDTQQERSLLSDFRRVHQALYLSVDANRGAPATGFIRIADSLDVLRTRLGQIIQINQRAITSTLARAETEAENTSDGSLWIAALALLATLGVAFWIIYTPGTPHAQSAHAQPQSTNERDRQAEIARAVSAQLHKIDEYKADMMRQISQELRTPLQTMHAAYYVLAEQIAGPLTDRQKQLVTTIRDNIDALSSFSSQYLDLAKIEAGMMHYQRQQVDLLSLLTPLVNATRASATAKEITIGIAAQTVPPVNVDPEKFNTVVTNLLDNAVKFTPRGGNITVSISPCASGARISIKDTGIGIDADDLPRVFTKFFQAKSAARIDAKGTGVGLALVKAIVDGHGGRVYASSTVGVGSTFVVEIPQSNTRRLPHPPDVN
jgi:signal transduction histidine kinase